MRRTISGITGAVFYAEAIRLCLDAPDQFRNVAIDQLIGMVACLIVGTWLLAYATEPECVRRHGIAQQAKG